MLTAGKFLASNAGVQFDSVGAGAKGTGNLSYSITLAAKGYVLVGASNVGSAKPTGATLGGTSMTVIGYRGHNNSSTQGVSVWGLDAVNAGTYTVEVSTATQTAMYSNAVAYIGVVSVSDPQYQSGSASSYTFTPTGVDPREMVVCFLGYGANTRTTSGGTSRAIDYGGTSAGVSAAWLAISDAKTPTTFGMSGSVSNSYGAVGVVLSP